MAIAARSRTKRKPVSRSGVSVARVLVADSQPASRLTLQTLLEASGYRVDSAASAAEAVGLMDAQEYQLVLTDLEMESPQAGLKVLAHARMKPYRPATAVITSSHSGDRDEAPSAEMLIAPEDVPELLTKVAFLIGARASRHVHRNLAAGR